MEALQDQYRAQSRGKQALRKYLQAAIGKEITPGIIAVIQSFGTKINFHTKLTSYLY